MENLKKPISLTEIRFPVYKLEKSKPIEMGTVVAYLRNDQLYIVDDTSIEKPTLGERRLQLAAQNFEAKQFNIYKLKNAIFFLGDFIKVATAGQWFIDSQGNTFVYKKSKIVPLVFKKIKTIIPIKTGGAIVEIEDIPSRYKCLYTPVNKHYAGLLELSSREYILYGLYETLQKNTRRKV